MTESKIHIKLGFHATENWQNVKTQLDLLLHMSRCSINGLVVFGT